MGEGEDAICNVYPSIVVSVATDEVQIPTVWIGISTVAQAVAIGVGSIIRWGIGSAGAVVAAVTIGIGANVRVVVIVVIGAGESGSRSGSGLVFPGLPRSSHCLQRPDSPRVRCANACLRAGPHRSTGTAAKHPLATKQPQESLSRWGHGFRECVHDTGDGHA